MKKIFGFLMAAAVLFGAASCAKEDISSSIANGEQVEVTFTANLPELGTRAIGYGEHANKLFYNVYEHGSDTPLNALCGIETSSTGKFYVTIPMIKGMKYDIVFWAQNADCGYYTLEGKKVNVVYNGKDANDDTRDAFFYFVNEFDPTNPAGKDDVKLRRPFAQLNAATDDIDAVAASGVSLVSSTVTVDTYTRLNIATGAVEGNPSRVTFAAKPLPTETLKAGYTYLSMNYILVNEKMLTTAAFEFKGERADHSVVTFTNTSYDNVPLQRNYKTNILGSLLTKSTDFNVEILPGFGGEEDYEVEKVHVATPESLVEEVNAAVATGGEIVLVDDIELNSTLTIADLSRTTSAEQKVIVIDGKGRTLTYTGGNRAIDVTASNVNLTIKNLTINCTASYCQRGINYNTDGALTLEDITVMGENVTYALNLPSNSDNAIVTINNSSLTGNIALNVWGENSVINAENSNFTSIDKVEAENYCAISLNNDGTNIADGTVVTITGGKITAKDEKGEPSSAVQNSTNTGKVVISNTTEVIGKTFIPVADVKYDGYSEFYSCATLQDAINKAIETNASSVVLVKDVELTETVTVAEGATVVLDLNGKTLAAADKNAIRNDGGNLTIKNGTVTRTGDVIGYAVNNASGEIVVENATITRGLYTSGSKLTATNANISHEQSSRHAIYAYNCEVILNSGTYHNDNAGNATIMATGSSVVEINGGTFSIADGRSTLGWTSSMFDQNNTAKVTINGGLFNGGFRVNSANTVLTVKGGEFNTNNGSGYTYYSGTVSIMGGTYTDDAAKTFAKKYVAEGYKINNNGEVVAGNYYDSAIVDWDGVRYEGEWFESGYMENALWLNNLVFSGDAAIKVENKTYKAIVIQNCSGSFKNNVITIANNNDSVMILENLNLTIAEGKKLIITANPYYQVFMTNITINGVKMTQESIAQYLENVVWYQVVE